ncbi:hypothetical protein K1719_037231 [Acacia pycnantha]|nr:hypothetical protein K1719_037231 [Acacia pycnantha]
MEQTTGGFTGFSLTAGESDQAALESIQFNEEIERIIAPAPENVSFTALLELPPAQAKEILHSPNCDGASAAAAAVVPAYVFAEENSSPEEPNLAPLSSGANLNRVKHEPPETDSNPKPTSVIASNPSIEYKNERATKRKEREKKDKEFSKKKSKSGADETSGGGDKLPYVHVRARRGQATDSHSLAERARREKINARMKLLQELVPGCNKISGTALVLDEIINHVYSLQRQVEFLSMKLAAVNPRVDFDLDSILATEGASRVDCNFPDMKTLLSYDSLANSASLQSNHLKMEL